MQPPGSPRLNCRGTKPARRPGHHSPLGVSSPRPDARQMDLSPIGSLRLRFAARRTRWAAVSKPGSVWACAALQARTLKPRGGNPDRHCRLKSQPGTTLYDVHAPSLDTARLPASGRFSGSERCRMMPRHGPREDLRPARPGAWYSGYMARDHPSARVVQRQMAQAGRGGC